MTVVTPLFSLPGALTDTQAAGDPRTLADGGLKWLSFQLWNDGPRGPFDFTPYGAVGIECGGWAVFYAAGSFYEDGLAFGQALVQSKAKHAMVDLEEAGKGQDPQPIIDGIKNAGWTGPVHLTTLGAPSDPLRDDFRIDPKPFLATGGGVFPQAYWAQSTDYLPERCHAYWTRVGVTEDHINYMVSLATYNGEQTNGKECAAYLPRVSAGQRYSIFMSQWASPADLAALKTLIPAPAPVPASTLQERTTKRRAQVDLLLDEQWADWKANGRDGSRTRMGMARSLLRQSDVQFALTLKLLGVSK